MPNLIEDYQNLLDRINAGEINLREKLATAVRGKRTRYIGGTTLEARHALNALSQLDQDLRLGTSSAPTGTDKEYFDKLKEAIDKAEANYKALGKH
jgi:hypothetical protein